jgi:hypothetical protein
LYYLQSLDEVIDKVIDIYINVIKNMYDRYEWDIYVHPVMPVLDITRSVLHQQRFGTVMVVIVW